MSPYGDDVRGVSKAGYKEQPLAKIEPQLPGVGLRDAFTFPDGRCRAEMLLSACLRVMQTELIGACFDEPLNVCEVVFGYPEI